jgi:hypothetical protein
VIFAVFGGRRIFVKKCRRIQRWWSSVEHR